MLTSDVGLSSYKQLDEVVEEECQYQRLEDFRPADAAWNRQVEPPTTEADRATDGVRDQPPPLRSRTTGRSSSETALILNQPAASQSSAVGSGSKDDRADQPWPQRSMSLSSQVRPSSARFTASQRKRALELWQKSDESARFTASQRKRALELWQKSDERSDSSDSDKECPPDPVLTPRSFQPLMRVRCQGGGISAMIYESSDNVAVFPRAVALSEAVTKINCALRPTDLKRLESALVQEYGSKLISAARIEAYMQALLDEIQLVLPGTVLPVYCGLSQEQCTELISTAEPGSFLCTSMGVGMYSEKCISFRNRTGTKHWTINSPQGGKFQIMNSPLFDNLTSFVHNFSSSLSDLTKLHVRQAVLAQLRPVNDPENIACIAELQQRCVDIGGDLFLLSDAILSTIQRVNASFGRGEDSCESALSGGPSESSTEALRGKAENSTKWYSGLSVRMSREEAEQTLVSNNLPGSYLIRRSDRGVGQFTVSYLGLDKVNHCRVEKAHDGTVTMPPDDKCFPSLEALASSLESMDQETLGVRLFPLLLHADS